MWRDPSGLFPGVDAERSAGSTSPPVSVPLGVYQSPLLGAPAGVAPPTPATPSSTCAAFGCTDPPAGDWTGRCEAHGEAFRDRAHELTGGIGRGEMDA